jgi:hypothetical protein
MFLRGWSVVFYDNFRVQNLVTLIIFKIFLSEGVQIIIFGVATPYSVGGYQCFRGTHFLHIQAT